MVLNNWYKLAINSKTFWIDNKGDFLNCHSHFEYLTDYWRELGDSSDKNYMKLLYDACNNDKPDIIKDFAVNNFGWSRAYIQSQWISIVCRNLLEYNVVKNLERFLFYIDPPDYNDIVIGDMNGRKTEFKWRDFLMSGISFGDFVEKFSIKDSGIFAR